MQLWAQDAEDLQVLSALLQDAVLRSADLGFDRARRRFALVLNRFCWEQPNQPMRVRAAVRIDHVLKVERAAWPQPDAVLDLLAVQCATADDGLGARLTLPFAGGPALRLQVEAVDVLLEDIGAAWPARMTPDHAD